MLTPLVKIGALRLGCEFETSLTHRRGIVLDKVRTDAPGVEVAFQDGLTIILHGDVRVRPLRLINLEPTDEESIH